MRISDWSSDVCSSDLAASNLFNLVICLFVFNRLATRLGVRNVAFIQPLTYFAVFGWFFLQGGTGAALAAFFAYHGVLTSIAYTNQNLMFNAVPSRVKRPLRTIVEGLAGPLASLDRKSTHLNQRPTCATRLPPSAYKKNSSPHPPHM